MPANRHQSNVLRQDAERLYTTATEFIRVYQFRDRNQTLRHGLTAAQAYVLELLLRRDDGWGLLELAAQLYLDKSTTSRIVSSMKKHRLVEWSRAEADRRAMVIVASPNGRKRYVRFREAIVRQNARLLSEFSQAERAAALRMLQRLADRAKP